MSRHRLYWLIPAHDFVRANVMSVADDHPKVPQPTAKNSKILEEASDWFARFRASHVKDEDRQAFERWCQQNPAHRQAFQRISSAWDHPVVMTAAKEIARSRDGRTRSHNHTRFGWWPAFSVAVSGAIVIVLAAWQWDVVTRSRADYYTAVGEQQTVHLPDRSIMTLNTQTAVAIEFKGPVRKIRLLKGQAFFNVASDPQRTFVVEHDGVAAKAVGTEFVVHAESKGMKVAVVEGLVRVADSVDAWQPLDLSAGHAVHVEPGIIQKPQAIDPFTTTAWLSKNLIVTSATLEDVVEEIRRYYPGTIVIWTPELKRRHVTGAYHLDDPAQLLNTLSKTLSFRLVTVADRLTVLY
ncbi:MAG: FecR family protein [Nitrospira sp.]